MMVSLFRIHVLDLHKINLIYKPNGNLTKHEMDSVARSFIGNHKSTAPPGAATQDTLQIPMPQDKIFDVFSSTFTTRHRNSQNVDANGNHKCVNVLILARRLQQVVSEFSSASDNSCTKCEPQHHYEITSQPWSHWNMLHLFMKIITFSICLQNVSTQAENTHSCKCV